MGLETAAYIDQLVAENPLGTDSKSQGDNHIRLLKSVLKSQFPTLGEVVINATGAQINTLTEITATPAEINKLDGVTSTTEQLNLVATIPVERTSIYDAVYPIGCIYQSTVATSPTTLFPGTTWTAFAAGRVLAGYDSGDNDFSAGLSGGSKTHTMTVAEMPTHTHDFTAMALVTGSLNTTGSSVKSESQSLTTEPTGSGNAFNIMQPYKVVYMWTRTA